MYAMEITFSSGFVAVNTFSSVKATNTSPETSSSLWAARIGNHLSKPIYKISD